MANAPFKLRSGNKSSFKMMGSSPAKQTEDGVPRKKQSVVSEDYKKTYDTGPVKGPENSDVMNIIKKRKQSGPQDSEENKQKEINKLVEKRDPNAGKRKIKTKKKATPPRRIPRQSPRMSPDAPVDLPTPPSAIDKIKKKVTNKIKNIYNEVTSDESVEKRNKKKNRREEREKKERDRLWNSITKGPFHPDSQ